MRREDRARIALALLAVVALSFQLRFSWDSLGVVLGRSDGVAAPFAMANDVVTTPRTEAAAAGVAPGDRIVAIDGAPFVSSSALPRALARHQAGETLALAIDRQGERRQVSVTLVAATELDVGDLVVATMTGVVIPLVSLALGFGVAVVRPLDLRAWILLLLMLSFSQVASPGEVDPGTWPQPFATIAVAWRNLLAAQSWAVGMLMLGIHFPDRLALDRRLPRLKWLLVAPLLVVAVASAVAAATSLHDPELARSIGEPLRAASGVTLALVVTAISLFFAIMGTRWGTAKDADARRRLSLLVWGSAIAVTPLGLLVIGSRLAGVAVGSLPYWAVTGPLLALLLFPLTLAYVIVVHRALDLRVVVRQGLQYAFARNAVLAVQVAASTLVVLGVVTLASDPRANRPRRIAPLAAGVWIVVGGQKLAGRARAFVDRRFFRDAFDAERILTELGEQVRTIVDVGELLETVERSVERSLHVELCVSMLPTADGVIIPNEPSGLPDPGRVRFPVTGATATRLREAGKPVDVDRNDPRWSAAVIGAGEADALAALGGELLVPLAMKGQLLGVLSLCPKRSEEPYAPSDVRLLASVAGQVAMALEHARLTAAIAHEAAQRERMKRELEIAREVQETLLPAGPPRVPGMELAGTCRPARGVGGDYYDFIALPDGAVGLAIADVAGKGIPAALLMAALQASLRAQTLDGAGDLAELMSRVNRLVHEASPGNRYVTFFFAQYEPASRRLTYVNAGHNAPMVLRANGTIDRLEAGGPVVGLLPIAAYAHAEVTLAPGDLFVSFTDGVSEAMNAASDEWGEERLAAAAQAARDLPVTQIVTRLMEGADAFAAGAPQHDDMTLLVARIG